jgi:hypothetical protein
MSNENDYKGIDWDLLRHQDLKVCAFGSIKRLQLHSHHDPWKCSFVQLKNYKHIQIHHSPLVTSSEFRSANVDDFIHLQLITRKSS